MLDSFCFDFKAMLFVFPDHESNGNIKYTIINHLLQIIEECLSSTNEVFSTVMDFYKKHSLLLPLKQSEEIIEIFQRLVGMRNFEVNFHSFWSFDF